MPFTIFKNLCTFSSNICIEYINFCSNIYLLKFLHIKIVKACSALGKSRFNNIFVLNL